LFHRDVNRCHKGAVDYLDMSLSLAERTFGEIERSAIGDSYPPLATLGITLFFRKTACLICLTNSHRKFNPFGILAILAILRRKKVEQFFGRGAAVQRSNGSDVGEIPVILINAALPSAKLFPARDFCESR